ncbi:thiamine phosphate synthase [Sphingomonas alpina]|uniref:Thiamine phosphate synthase n=1 Tax=Sphingomonas alpina TaxID=653931 RepID=A0A7H0LHD4_9SPHN|nr:thiamine phosphate synthase [Sphingomonas alpina]QNQ09087.1 thiamine phosphate synthase [Sphingomonas alpina]
MSDERIGDDLWQSLEALPRGAGVVFRHFDTALPARRMLFARLLRLARRKGLILVRAGSERMAGEMGVHGPGRMPGGGIRTWPAHSRREAMAGVSAGADLIFVSPIFPTRTHPGAVSLGPVRAALMTKGLGPRRIALGGMNASRGRRMVRLGFYGWAAIDAWQPNRKDQKRNAVPI